MSTEKAALRKAIRARYPGKSQRDAESARLCAVIAQSDLFRPRKCRCRVCADGAGG